MLQNLKIFKDPFQGGIPHCGILNFKRDVVLSDTYNGSKFEFCAFSGLTPYRSCSKSMLTASSGGQVTL